MKLYKYFAPNDYSIDALVNHYWWFSKREYLNDPFDTHGEIISKYPLFLQELEKRGINSSVGDYSDLLDDFGICCFSKIPDNKHLWALYADSYKGWALEFESEEYIRDIIKMKSDQIIDQMEVQYLNSWPDLDNLSTQISFPTTNGNIYQTIQALLFNDKSTDSLFKYLLSIKELSVWGNEKEVRFITGKIYAGLHPELKTANGYKIYYPQQILKSIIVGMNISEENLARLKSFVQGHPEVELKKIQIGDSKSLSLKIVKI